jgi:hypothetical protein
MDNILECSKRKHTHCPASGAINGNGGFLVDSIQVHPLGRLQVEWAWSGLDGEGGGYLTPLHMISRMAGSSRDLLKHLLFLI